MKLPACYRGTVLTTANLYGILAWLLKPNICQRKSQFDHLKGVRQLHRTSYAHYRLVVGHTYKPDLDIVFAMHVRKSNVHTHPWVLTRKLACPNDAK